MPKKLSSETEAKLLAVIEKTAEFVNAGDSPSQAIAKAASEKGLGPGYVNLVVHAYNTGRTAKQRQDGDSPLEKAADFPLADATEVLEILYPTKVKTAAARAQDTQVSPQYAFSPVGLLQRRAQREKAARAIDWGMGVPKPDPYPRDPKEQVKRAAAQVDRMRREVEEARRRVTMAWEKVARSFDELTDYFRSPTSIPLPVVRENVMLLHGGRGETIMDQLIKVSPTLTKLAMHVEGQSLLGPRGRPKSVFDAWMRQPAVGKPYEIVARIFDELGDYGTLKEAYDHLAAERAQQSEVLLRPFVQPGVSPSVLGEEPSSTTEKVAFGPLSALGTMGIIKEIGGTIAGGLKGPDEPKLVQKNLDKITDPEHEAKLRAISTQAMLQDLMINDPVISGYDPEEVTTAFNEIAQAAPRGSDQRLIMQAALRKRLQQGALDPFDVDQLMGIDAKLRTREFGEDAARPGGGDGSVL